MPGSQPRCTVFRSIGADDARPKATPTDKSNSKKLRDAAEPFEKLTEISFSAALLKIDQTIGEAEAAAERTRGFLSNEAARQLDAQIAAIKSARQK